eukprot:gene489-1134_t
MGANASANFACGSDAVVPREVPTFKVCLVGDADVGKTSIFLRYTKNQFDYSYQPTMTVNIGNVVKKVNIPFETVVCISMWDLPGREEVDLRRSYYTDIDAAVVVVDLSDPQSIDMAGTWRQDILNNVYLSDDSELITGNRNQTNIQKSIPILLVGNKLDKVESSDTATSEEVSERMKMLEDVAEEQGFVGCVSVSAKENDGGVHAAMQSLIRYLLEKKGNSKDRNTKQDAKQQHLFKSPADAEVYAKTLGTAEDHTFIPLERINIKEFDNIFDKANPKVKTIEKTSISFLVSMRNFKKSCCAAGLTNEYKASTEECITGLREQIKNENSEDCLEAHEDGGFVKLVLSGRHRTTEPIQKIVDFFNSEVYPPCKDVLLQCPVAKISLEDGVAQSSEIYDEAINLGHAVGLVEKYCRNAQIRIKSNEERLKETIKLADETMKIVDEEYQRIKKAMMW